MYLDSITINNFRTFREARIDFLHKDRAPTTELPLPELPNINLLLGNNGLGKTTLLQAVSLTALGPAATDSGVYHYRLVRREPSGIRTTEQSGKFESPPVGTAILNAEFRTHHQDNTPVQGLHSRIKISRRGDLEQLRWDYDDGPEKEKNWSPIFSSSSQALFFVGYGAARRVERRESIDLAGRKKRSFVRAQRILSLFDDTYSLIPLSVWLPSFKQEYPGLFVQAVDLINQLMGEDHYKFTGDLEDNEYVFEQGGLKTPFPALSDGYRAYLGWIGDLLFHLCATCPPDGRLADNHGIVMVDEIDLHIHPEWQINLLPILARSLPNIQFIVTSHSPLVAGSLEWSNIIHMSAGPEQTSEPGRIRQSIHGLDADQILLTDFFGLSSTRSQAKELKLQKLTEKARAGDTAAASDLLRELSKGLE